MTTAEDTARTPPGRHTLKLLVVPVIVLMLCSQVANATWATLYEDHPLLLIALSAINRYLVLVSDKLDAVSYYGVGTLRLVVSDPLFFLLGFWYGDKALAWMDGRSKTFGPLMRDGQRLFGKAAWPLVAIAPNNFVCLFAGAAGMRVVTFYALNLTGTIGRLYLIRVFGDAFSDPISGFRDFVADYRLWFLLSSIAIVLFVLRNEFRSGGEIDELLHIDETLLDDHGSDAESGPPADRNAEASE